MRKPNLILVTLILIIIGSILYFCRQIFFYRYEPEYYENYYYNSQWNVPQSTRGISDGELYKFIGYRLVQGENPFNVNYEVPPFAKYLYGLSEAAFGNPYWVSIGFYLLGAVAIFIISQELFADYRSSILAVLLYVTTPFLATQVKETMLDLPLSILLLYSSMFFVKFLKSSGVKNLIMAGIFLGLATGTKIGVYTPFLLLLGLLVIVGRSKKTIGPVVYLFSTIAGYLLSFYSYFVHHPNPIPWIRLHEKTLSFYLHSTISNLDYWQQWRGIFMNQYQGFWVGAASTGLGDWSFILPMGVIFSILILIYALKKRNLTWIYLVSFSFVILIVNTYLPFWARYLMPAVPLLILFVIYFFRRNLILILLMSALNLSLLYPTLTNNNLSGHTSAVERFLNTRAYRELYRSVDSETRAKYSEATFQAALEDFYKTLSVKKINIKIVDQTMSVSYQTNLGTISHSQGITSRLEHNQWKTIWSWDYLWPGYDPLRPLDTNKILPNPATNKRIAVYVIPRLMYDWGKYSSALSTLTRLKNQDVDAKVRETIPDDFPRFVGFLNSEVDPITQSKNILPGIELRQEDFAL